MFVLSANKNQLSVQQREPVTSGSVNVYPVSFQFSEDWDGLARTAIFRAGAESRAVSLSEDNQTVIPWEVLEVPNVHLFAGVYGTQGGHTVLPTIWADLGTILTGAAPGTSAQPRTPDLWEQALAEKGDRLAFTEEQNLGLYSGEHLLSDVPLKAVEGLQGPPGLDGFSPTVSVEDIEGGHKVTITDATHTAAFLVMDGKDGPGGGGSEYTAGDGISIENNTINVKKTVYPILTQAEYDGLPEAEKKKGLHIVDDGYGVTLVESNIYSTKETIVGRWIDGKPLYRKVLLTKTPDNHSAKMIEYLGQGCIVLNAYGFFNDKYDTRTQISTYVNPSTHANVYLNGAGNELWMFCEDSSNKYYNCDATIIVEYIKTTDPSLSIIPNLSSNANTMLPNDSKLVSPSIDIPKSGTIIQDGMDYDYMLPDNVFAQASASASNASFGFASKSSF